MEYGYTGQSLSWTATDANPDTYTIELQGSGIVAGPTDEAYLVITSLYKVKQQKDMKNAVRTLISLNKDTKLYAVYHCGARTVNVNRPWEDMEKDWSLIKVN